MLIYRNTTLGVIEAKAWDCELTKGLGQAKDYANKLDVRFAYSTNGRGIFAVDMREGTEGEVPRYLTPIDLWNSTFEQQNAWRDRFAVVPFEDRGGYYQGRYYQDIVIDRVLEAIANGRDRIPHLRGVPAISISSCGITRKSARADLRHKVRRLLAMYGYPPNLSEDATQLVLRQAALSTENGAD